MRSSNTQADFSCFGWALRRFSAILCEVTFWSKMSYAYRWKGDQMFYLLVKALFAYLLPVSLKSLCFSVLSTKRQFRSVL